jgi:RNA-directed DNA polymerase
VQFRRPTHPFGRCYSPKTGRAYWGTTPSKKRVQRLCKAISEMTRRSQTQQDAGTLVAALNRKINGWANYFCLGPVSNAYRAVEGTEHGQMLGVAIACGQ